VKSFLIKISHGNITTQNIDWLQFDDKQIFYDGFIIEEDFANINNLDGNYSCISLEKDKIDAFTDFWGTKPLFYAREQDNIIITSDPFKYEVQTFKIIPRNTTLTINLKSLDYSLHRKAGLNIKYDITTNEFVDCIQNIINKIKSRNLGILLSEGYDSGAITSILLSTGKKFFAATIDLGVATHILYQRHKLLESGCIISPKIVDDLKIYKIYKSKADRLILNESYEPDYTSAWGFKGTCMLLEALKNHNIDTCLHGAGADALFLPNVEKYIEYNMYRELPYPYNLALDIHHSCLKGEFISKMFGIDIIYIYLFKKVWELGIGAIQKNNTKYKQVLAEIMESNSFPFIPQTSFRGKIGLERCRLNSFL